jgi:hypothetical protein
VSIVEFETQVTWPYTLRQLPTSGLLVTTAIAGRYAYGGSPPPSPNELRALAKIIHKIVYRELHRRKHGYHRYPASGYDNNTVIH